MERRFDTKRKAQEKNEEEVKTEEMKMDMKKRVLNLVRMTL